MDRDLKIRVILSKVGDLIGPLRGISTQSKKAGDALKATQGELKKLRASERDVARYNELSAKLKKLNAPLSDARDKLNALQREMGKAQEPTKTLVRNFERAQTKVKKLNEGFDKEYKSVKALSEKFKAAGIDAAFLSTYETKLAAEVSRTTRAVDAQKSAFGKLEQTRKSRAATSRQLAQTQTFASHVAVAGAASTGTGLAVLAPLKAMIDQASQYQTIMTSVGQKGDLSRAEATKLGNQLASLAPKVNQLPAALAEGADALAGLGLNAKQAVAMLDPVGRAATAYNAEILDLSKASFAVVDNLKVPLASSARALDVMAAAGKAGKFEIKDMAQYFPMLTASAAALGQTGVPAVADLAAALQITAKGSGDAGTAANNLQNLLVKINAPATAAKFKKMGVDVGAALKKLEAEGRSPIEAIAELTNTTLHGDLSKLGNLFEDMQVQAALRPIISNIGEFRRIRALALAANGTVERDFNERMKDTAQQSQRLSVATQALQIKLGTLLLPTVAALAEKLNRVTEPLMNWADAHPALVKWILITALSVGALLLFMGGLAIVAAGIIGPFGNLRFAIIKLSPLLIKLAWGLNGVFWRMLPLIASTWAWTAALLANPLTWIALAVVGVIALAVAIYKHWGAITGFVSGLWTKLQTFFHSGLTNIIATLLSFNPIGMLLGKNLITGIINGIVSMSGALKSAVVEAGSAVMNWFKAKLGIHSPSRVFASYGMNLMHGLANGIGGNAHAPLAHIQRVSRDITAALAIGAASVSPAAAATGKAGSPAGLHAGAGGAPTYNIKVYGAPGQSPDAIAKAVAAEIDKRDRAKAAAKRSSMSDYGD